MCLFASGFIWIVSTIKRSFGSLEADCRPSVFWSRKNKNGRRSLPCYFLVNGLLYCPPASLSVGEDKHRQWTLMRHEGFKTSPRPPWPSCQSRTCSSLSVVYCTQAKRHPRSLWLPHRSDQNCLLPYEGQFPIHSLHKTDKAILNLEVSGHCCYWPTELLCVGKTLIAKNGNLSDLWTLT